MGLKLTETELNNLLNKNSKLKVAKETKSKNKSTKKISIIEDIEVLDEPVSLRNGFSSMLRPKADGQKEQHGNS